MNDLRLDKVHTVFLDQGFVSLAALQEGLSRDVCYDSFFALVTDPPDRLHHLHHMDVSGGFRFVTRFDVFRDLGVFFRPHLGVELSRLIAQTKILQPTWDRH